MELYIEYFSNHMGDYLGMVGQHIRLSLLAVFLAVVIGVPFGILTTKSKGVYQFITTIFSTLRIIPSLAILVILIPVMGIGMKPALVALTVLAVPPILINTALGFHQVEDFMLEVAEGMGMPPRQIFRKVSFPLAFPYIMTGIKTAVSEIIASATLAAYIGSGGLGVLIYNGISLMKTEYLVIGGASVALLTVVFNLALGRLQGRFTRYRTSL
ncbi:ABC transporter permease [Blautia schinkii]|nr:ABC transporter permease [Blautia schinkii]